MTGQREGDIKSAEVGTDCQEVGRGILNQQRWVRIDRTEEGGYKISRSGRGLTGGKGDIKSAEVGMD